MHLGWKHQVVLGMRVWKETSVLSAFAEKGFKVFFLIAPHVLR